VELDIEINDPRWP